MPETGLTPGQMKVLRFLVKDEEHFGSKRVLGPGCIGIEIWGKGKHRDPQAYARVAGKVLRALEKKGFVRHELRLGYLGWQLSYKGKKAYEATNA